MGSKRKSAVKKPTRKEISVALRAKQEEIQTAEKTWKTRLHDQRAAFHKEVMHFKLERTGIVKEANKKRKAALAGAAAKREKRKSKIGTGFALVVKEAENRANAARGAVEEEYLETKRRENAEFQEISDCVSKGYGPDLKALLGRAAREYEVLDVEGKQQIEELKSEESKLQLALDDTRKASPQKTSEVSASP